MSKEIEKELESYRNITVAMALDIAAVGEALGIPGDEQEGGTGEFIEAIEELKAERDSLAAQLAELKGQEPVGYVYTMQPCFPGEPKRAHAQMHKALPEGTKLYAQPVAPAQPVDSPPTRVVWIDAHHVIDGAGTSFIRDVALVSSVRTSDSQIALSIHALAAPQPESQEGSV